MPSCKVYFTTLLISLFTASAGGAISSPADAGVKIASISPATSSSRLHQAQVLNQQGSEYLAAGRPQLALANWQQAHQIYVALQDKEGMMGTNINQAQAFQALGFYRQALLVLRSVQANLQKEPNSLLKVRSLHSLGNTLVSMRFLRAKAGKAALEDDWGAQEILTAALQMAIEIRDQSATDQIKLSLGNIFQLTNAPAQAIEQYQAVINSTTSPLLKVQAQISLYRLAAQQETNADALVFLTNIKKDLDTIPASRSTIYAYVKLAKSIHKNQPDRLADPALLRQVGELFTTAIGQARTIQDARGEAQAVGALGNLYQLTGQHQYAQKLTEQALVIAESLPAPDLAYRLQWQLGRILTITSPQNTTATITAYRQAVAHLKTLRNDLNASDADLQFSFRDSVEPVYRELVDLLLQDDGKILAANLTTARDLIESLQVAELENFLRQGCLDTYTVPLDKIDRSAVVIYPIVLRDRVAIITSTPQQPLRYYSRPIAAARVQKLVTSLRERVEKQEFNAQEEEEFLQQSHQIYNLLIAPLAADLQKSKTKTLVFVLDGVLRNIPMSVLHDGKNYLFEKYNLALTPGLQLVPPQNSLDRRQYQAFLGGISEARQGFPAIGGVKKELAAISNLVPNQQLLNADFNQRQASSRLVSDDSSIVHLATHGQFSSKPEDTFILTWDSRLDLNQLNSLLQSRNIQSGKIIDLLVLSACQTASGDSRATLGLAGVAIRARTRSTIASLWSVNDQATQLLMTNLYQNLVTKKLGKAESLGLAQRSLLRSPQYRSPYYWAPFVLVGNWQ
jgi:CHAT domain-containing protein